MESPNASPASPQMMMRPFCIMKPVRNPVFPPTIIVPPFIDMPARAPGVSANEEFAAPHGGARRGSGVLGYRDTARHHVVAHRPAGVPGDGDPRAVEQAGGVVADAAVDSDIAVLEDGDGEVMPRVRVRQGDAGLPGGKVLEPEVDLAGGECGGVYSNQVMTSLFCGSTRSISSENTPRSAISSEAMAMTSSVSMVTKGLADHSSLA